MKISELSAIHDAGHGTYFPGPCPECEALKGTLMPNPDNIELTTANEKISTLNLEIDRLRRRIFLLETLLGDMLEDRTKPRRRHKHPTWTKDPAQ